MWQYLCENYKTICDWTAVTGTGAVLVGLLPNLSAILSFIWLCIRVWESDTVQKLVAKFFKKEK